VDGNSEDHSRFVSSYFKEGQSRKRAKSKKEKTATLAKIAAKKKSKRVVELEATIRTSRIGIVVEFGTARLLQPQPHTHSSHLLVGCWVLVVEARWSEEVLLFKNGSEAARRACSCLPAGLFRIQDLPVSREVTSETQLVRVSFWWESQIPAAARISRRGSSSGFWKATAEHLSRERFQKRQGKELHLENRLVVEGSFLPVAALAASLLATLVTTALTTVAIK
jgi:hypothetical protein